MDGDSIRARQRIGFGEMSGGAGAPLLAIVGAGFSGTMAAVHLRRALPAHFTIGLFERSGRFARGPAYAATEAPHLLNVRAKNMSALPDAPDDFDQWLEAQGVPAEVVRTPAGNFATRRAYGRYLRQLLYREMVGSGGRLRLASADVVSITPVPGGYRLGFANGGGIDAAGVVLAIGNLHAPEPQDGVVYQNPWTDRATEALRPDETVLIVGTGLSMIDLTLDIRARGFMGPIVALSRRGLVPHRHEPVATAWSSLPLSLALTEGERHSLLKLLRRIRSEVAAAAEAGVDWRAVIDGLRPITATLWRSLPAVERARFLRHVRPFWDVHRHRIAPTAAAAFASLRESGELRIRRGRVRSVEVRGETADVVIQDPRGGCETIRVQRVIHAVGPRGVHETETPMSDLNARGLARIDAHGMGVEVTDALELVGVDGAVTPGLWALGPAVRGAFWECTAVPDIRVQAATLARRVASALAPTPGVVEET
jgi:uncharacterized NAD(P)/FAD-binding protein YdhS